MTTNTPANLLYTKDHEWVSSDSNTLTIGITDFAQRQLGDVVFVELPAVGREITQNEPFGTIESVKAASEVFAPISGKIIEINDELNDSPELVNMDPYTDGWLIKVRSENFASEKGSLLSAAEYEAFTRDESDK